MLSPFVFVTVKETDLSVFFAQLAGVIATLDEWFAFTIVADIIKQRIAIGIIFVIFIVSIN
jgi:hypothetical protein